MSIQAPHAPSPAIAQEFARDLFVSHMDPSDPDACFRFLADLYPNRLREVLANANRAAWDAGQMYIDADIARRVA